MKAGQGQGPRPWALAGRPRGVSSWSFPLLWRQLQPQGWPRLPGCAANQDVEVKMSPRLLPGFGLSWSPSCCSGPRGPWLVAGGPSVALLSPRPARQGLRRPPVPLPAFQSLPGAFSAGVCGRGCACVHRHVVWSFCPAFITVAREAKGRVPRPQPLCGAWAVAKLRSRCAVPLSLSFSNPLSALLPINNSECCRHRARRGPRQGAVGGQLGAHRHLAAGPY